MGKYNIGTYNLQDREESGIGICQDFNTSPQVPQGNEKYWIEYIRQNISKKQAEMTNEAQYNYKSIIQRYKYKSMICGIKKNIKCNVKGSYRSNESVNKSENSSNKTKLPDV